MPPPPVPLPTAQPSMAAQMGLANAPFLAAPQISPMNPVGAPPMGMLGRARYKFAQMNPMQQQILMRALQGSGEMPPGGRGGMSGDDYELMRQRLGTFGALPNQMGAMGAHAGGPTYPMPSGGQMPAPTDTRNFPTMPVMPSNATAPQLISRLGSAANMIRQRYGGY